MSTVRIVVLKRTKIFTLLRRRKEQTSTRKRISVTYHLEYKRDIWNHEQWFSQDAGIITFFEAHTNNQIGNRLQKAREAGQWDPEHVTWTFKTRKEAERLMTLAVLQFS